MSTLSSFCICKLRIQTSRPYKLCYSSNKHVNVSYHCLMTLVYTLHAGGLQIKLSDQSSKRVGGSIKKNRDWCCESSYTARGEVRRLCAWSRLSVNVHTCSAILHVESWDVCALEVGSLYTCTRVPQFIPVLEALE